MSNGFIRSFRGHLLLPLRPHPKCQHRKLNKLSEIKIQVEDRRVQPLKLGFHATFPLKTALTRNTFDRYEPPMNFHRTPAKGKIN